MVSSFVESVTYLLRVSQCKDTLPRHKKGLRCQPATGCFARQLRQTVALRSIVQCSRHLRGMVYYKHSQKFNIQRCVLTRTYVLTSDNIAIWPGA